MVVIDKAIKAVFWEPGPKIQMQKCRSILITKLRALDHDIDSLKQAENKARAQILELPIRTRKQSGRLITCKAQSESVKLQVGEAFAIRRSEDRLKASTGIMKDVNALVRLPELVGTMQQLSQELIKAGVIEEMADDVLPADEMAESEDEETEAELNKILEEVLKTTPAALPDTRLTNMPEIVKETEQDQQQTLAQMRGRLEALKS